MIRRSDRRRIVLSGRICLLGRRGLDARLPKTQWRESREGGVTDGATADDGDFALLLWTRHDWLYDVTAGDEARKSEEIERKGKEGPQGPGLWSELEMGHLLAWHSLSSWLGKLHKVGGGW